ncbi:MAG TPA: hypothetical protein VMJ10_30700 [Kofleriaceae bacterium]|nr:hypothetical protein [Kofleriaceae bacterium]
MTMLLYEVVAKGDAAKDFVRFRVAPDRDARRVALLARGWIEDPRSGSLVRNLGAARAVAFAPDHGEGDVSEGQEPASDDAIALWLRSVEGMAPLAGFESLAELKSMGVGWSHEHGRIARLEWRRGDEFEQQEQLLRERGFAATSDAAIWSHSDGALSVVFMGGTLYSHLGPLPTEYGGWPTDSAEP